MKLSMARRVVNCNHVLFSTLGGFFIFYFFITTCSGSNKILRNNRGAIRNYLLYGNKQLMLGLVEKSIALKKKYRGLGLVDPGVAKTSLLFKWIVKVLEPKESNLQLMLKYQLDGFNPQRGRSWGVSFDWLPINNTKVFQAPRFGGTLLKR